MTEAQATELIAIGQNIITLLQFGIGVSLAIIVACVWRYL